MTIVTSMIGSEWTIHELTDGSFEVESPDSLDIHHFPASWTTALIAEYFLTNWA